MLSLPFSTHRQLSFDTIIVKISLQMQNIQFSPIQLYYVICDVTTVKKISKFDDQPLVHIISFHLIPHLLKSAHKQRNAEGGFQQPPPLVQNVSEKIRGGPSNPPLQVSTTIFLLGNYLEFFDADFFSVSTNEKYALMNFLVQNVR